MKFIIRTHALSCQNVWVTQWAKIEEFLCTSSNWLWSNAPGPPDFWSRQVKAPVKSRVDRECFECLEPAGPISKTIERTWCFFGWTNREISSYRLEIGLKWSSISPLGKSLLNWFERYQRAEWRKRLAIWAKLSSQNPIYPWKTARFKSGEVELSTVRTYRCRKEVRNSY